MTRAGSYGWDLANPRTRVFDPEKPLYVYKASNVGGIYVGEAFVPRGHELPTHLARELGAERVKLMHFVRELDHAPIDGLTPTDQLPAARTEHVPSRKERRAVGK